MGIFFFWIFASSQRYYCSNCLDILVATSPSESLILSVLCPFVPLSPPFLHWITREKTAYLQDAIRRQIREIQTYHSLIIISEALTLSLTLPIFITL